MSASANEDPFDPDQILETLDRHAVSYVLVGGVAARAHGALRSTADIDCVPDTSRENLIVSQLSFGSSGPGSVWLV